MVSFLCHTRPVNHIAPFHNKALVSKPCAQSEQLTGDSVVLIVRHPTLHPPELRTTLFVTSLKGLGEGDDAPGVESAVWAAAEEARCGGLGLAVGRLETTHRHKMNLQFVGKSSGGQ